MSALPADSSADVVVCLCRQVPRSRIKQAIERDGAASLADLQAQTTACTRCFGCRFELQELLSERLGDAYDRGETLTVPERPTSRRWLPRHFRRGPTVLPRRMYMPVLSGYRGLDVQTRMVMFNWGDDGDVRPARLRLDLLTLDGERLAAREVVIPNTHSAVIGAADMLGGKALPGGVGYFKAVVEAAELGSMRPYFHFVSPGGITTTHEKANTLRPDIIKDRSMYWLFPIAPRSRPLEAYFAMVNTQSEPMDGQELVWCDAEGNEERAPLSGMGLDQGAFAPLHELFPRILESPLAGGVRLNPARHKVAGWMVTRDPATDVWRVQHL